MFTVLRDFDAQWPMQKFVHLFGQSKETLGKASSGADGPKTADGAAAQLLGLYAVSMFWSQEAGSRSLQPESSNQIKLNSKYLPQIIREQIHADD